MAILTGTNCTVTRLGAGLENCQVVEGLPNGVILVPPTWSLTKASGTFNKEYVQGQIQAGNFIPLVGSFEATPETPEATKQESQSGISSVVRQGKPMFKFTFQKGLAFQKIAYSFNSFAQYSVILTYETGAVKLVETVDGLSIKGFTIGMFNTNGYTENNGSVNSSTTIEFQITDPYEYNRYAIALSDLDFNPGTELYGITDCILTGRADVSEAKVYVKVAWLHNEQYPILGLAAANFRLTIDGVVDTISGAVTYNSTTKEYAITPTTTLTTGQAVLVELYDSVASVDAAKVGNKFYQGTTGTITPVA